MVFRSFPAVEDGFLSVAVSDQRLVGRMRVVLCFVVLRGLMVMSRRSLVMFCCERMVFCACADPGHRSSLSSMRLEAPRDESELNCAPISIECPNICFSYLVSSRFVFKLFITFS